MRTSNLGAVLVLCFLFVVSCSGPVQTPNDEKRDDYDVYSAYIEQSVKFSEPRTGLLICSNTITSDSGESFAGKIPKRFHPGELEQSLIQSFDQAASGSAELTNHFKLPFRYQLVSQEKLTALTEKLEPGFNREKAIMNEFPNSTLPIFLSRIGYGDDGSTALLYVARMGVDSRYVLMRKEQGKWRIDSERWSSTV